MDDELRGSVVPYGAIASAGPIPFPSPGGADSTRPMPSIGEISPTGQPRLPGVWTPETDDSVAASLIRVAIATPVAVRTAVFPYGGFWIRLLAYAIDQVVVLGTCFTTGAAVAFTVSLFGGDAMADAEISPAAWSWLANAIGITYRIIFPPLLGGTPGKLLVGYHIVDEDGRHITFRRSIGRFLAQILSGLVLGLGYITIAASSHKQGWHDQIADTYVVRKELVRP